MSSEDTALGKRKLDGSSSEAAGRGAAEVLARFRPFDPNEREKLENGDADAVNEQAKTPLLSLSLGSSPAELRRILSRLLASGQSAEAPTMDTSRLSFLVEGTPLSEHESLAVSLDRLQRTTEREIEIVYVPLSFFRCFPVTRCSASLSGHDEPVLSVQFSPSGASLATGSGDRCIRIWDLTTQTAQLTLRGHSGWILALAWSPDETKLASGSLDGELRVWSPAKGAQLGSPLRGHSAHINALAWEPLSSAATGASSGAGCRRLASASKDGSVRVWDTHAGRALFSLTSHTASVTCLRWGVLGLIYSGSQDRSIKVWAVEATRGKLVRTLTGHSHWINCMALSSDFAIRSGAFPPSTPSKVAEGSVSASQMVAHAKESAERALAAHGNTERLITGSDDFSLFLWEPAKQKKPIARLTGHQNLINWVGFSPDGTLLASASFDKSIKIWRANNGKFVTSLRGHVAAVYAGCFSADSRLLVTGSRDSTVKVWSLETYKLLFDLPGHADEVFAVDWSPDGQTVVSGSKDKTIKLWRK